MTKGTRKLYARQNPVSGMFWFYVESANGDRATVGHCGRTRPCMACDGEGYVFGGVGCDSCSTTGTVRKTDPCTGHPTADEAQQHFREYLVDLASARPATLDDAVVCAAPHEDCQSVATHVMDSGWADTSMVCCHDHCSRGHYLRFLELVDFTSR